MNRIKIHSIALLAGAALLAASCAKTTGDEAASLRSETGDYVVSFTVNAPDAVPVAGSRAVDTDYQLAGQTGENEVNRITLFLVGVNYGVEQFGSDVVTYSQAIAAAHKNDATHSCSFSTSGTKNFTQHIYIGANLTDAQIASFAAGNPLVSSAGTVTGILDEVMDFSSGNDGSGDGRNIAMFVKVRNPAAASGASDPYLFTLTGNDNLNGTGAGAQAIKLERLVGKVLLTFTTEKVDGQDNIIFQADEHLSGWSSHKVWCTMSDISYTVLPAGRKLYLAGQATPDKLSDYVSLDAYDNVITNDGRNLYFTIPMDPDARPLSPQVYDESKLKATSASSSNASTHYFQGMYTLENLWTNDISNPATYGAGLTMDDIARGMLPSVLIRMKLVPARLHIYTTAETINDRRNSPNRAAAEGYLGYDGTFYYYVGPDRGSQAANQNYQGFYTPDCYNAAVALGLRDPDDFIRFEGGYCYYRTFINAPAKNGDGIQTYAGSNGSVVGIKRNSYHILNVPRVPLPGAPLEDDFIHVGATIIDWNDRGSTTVDVNPSLNP